MKRCIVTAQVHCSEVKESRVVDDSGIFRQNSVRLSDTCKITNITKVRYFVERCKYVNTSKSFMRCVMLVFILSGR